MGVTGVGIEDDGLLRAALVFALGTKHLVGLIFCNEFDLICAGSERAINLVWDTQHPVGRPRPILPHAVKHVGVREFFICHQMRAKLLPIKRALERARISSYSERVRTPVEHHIAVAIEQRLLDAPIIWHLPAVEFFAGPKAQNLEWQFRAEPPEQGLVVIGHDPAGELAELARQRGKIWSWTEIKDHHPATNCQDL